MDNDVLIFGATGQDGYYLSKVFMASGYRVIAYSRANGGDVTDRDFVAREITRIQPKLVFHLAAVSSTRHDVLFENHSIIAGGALNILEAVYRYSPESRVLIVGSGVQFENTGVPIPETAAFAPSSPYAISRIHSVYAARYYRRLGVKAYVGYLFHHESPYRKPEHLSKRIADLVVRVKAGSKEKIVLGDLSVRKEYGFAGDIADGMRLLLSQEKVFEAVIGTGVAYSVEFWLETCFARIGRNWRDYVTGIPAGGFQSEYKTLVSDPSTMFELGWKPSVSVVDLAKMMVPLEDK